jgi:hypothetical protein
MNTKLTLASIVLAMFLIATACSAETSSLPALDPAQPEAASYEIVPLVPVTGVNAAENVYDYEQEARAYPSHQVHSACASADIHRQSRCEVKEQIRETLLPGNGNTEAPAAPLQKLHSHCVSEDLNRQYYCMD